jgi:predicted metal-dependent phosphoesterase TrpH
MTPDKIINIAKRKGLSGIAITDHNTIRGGIKGVKLNKCEEFAVICGSEISTDKGDIIGLFLTEDVRSKEALEVVDEIRTQGGISIIAHPYKRSIKVSEKLLKEVNGVEGLNGRSLASANKKAREIARKNHLSIIAGSDAHFYFEIGRAFTFLDSNTLDMDDLKKSLINGKTRIFGSELPLYVETFSQLVRMIKTKEPSVIIDTGLGIVYATYYELKEKLRAR